MSKNIFFYELNNNYIIDQDKCFIANSSLSNKAGL